MSVGLPSPIERAISIILEWPPVLVPIQRLSAGWKSGKAGFLLGGTFGGDTDIPPAGKLM